MVYPAVAAARQNEPVAAETDRGLVLAQQFQTAFADIADRVSPSVVGITVYEKDPAAAGVDRSGWQEAGRQAARYPGYRPLRSGSGVVVSGEGYIHDQLGVAQGSTTMNS